MTWHIQLHKSDEFFLKDLLLELLSANAIWQIGLTMKKSKFKQEIIITFAKKNYCKIFLIKLQALVSSALEQLLNCKDYFSLKIDPKNTKVDLVLNYLSRQVNVST